MKGQEIRNSWITALTTANNGSDLSSDIEWGFSTQDLLVLMCYHKAGLFREKIEDLLEDCNFHTECGLLNEGKYDECLDTIIEDMTS